LELKKTATNNRLKNNFIVFIIIKFKVHLSKLRINLYNLFDNFEQTEN
jgi:hypothetical protein